MRGTRPLQQRRNLPNDRFRRSWSGRYPDRENALNEGDDGRGGDAHGYGADQHQDQGKRQGYRKGDHFLALGRNQIHHANHFEVIIGGDGAVENRCDLESSEHAG